MIAHRAAANQSFKPIKRQSIEGLSFVQPFNYRYCRILSICRATKPSLPLPLKNEVSLLFHARTLLRTIRISTTVATIASTCITGKAHKPKV